MKYSTLFVSVAYPCLWYYYFSSAFVLVQEHQPTPIVIQEGIKEQAFSVLRDKCNVCHATKKKTDIFTLGNMDSLAPDIHKQVFVKRKMPKGRKIKLTDEETETLREWVLMAIDGHNLTN